MDTLASTAKGTLAIGGYIDTYYTYNFSLPKNQNSPYFISSHRHNEFNINLAYIDLRYQSTRFRARLVPGFGTYMNTNYANEVGSLKNLVEAYAGVLVWAKRKIWVDIGVLGSPYTNESAVSKNHLIYLRLFAPKRFLIYLAGMKVSVPLQTKWNLYFYLLNG